MILKSLSPQHVGPFFPSDEITFESDITVITGQNDSGKSKLLQLIRTIIERSAISENEVSIAHRVPPTAPWEDDRRIVASASFLTDRDQGSRPVDIEYQLAPSCYQYRWSGDFTYNGSRLKASDHYNRITGWPRCITIGTGFSDEIRPEIPLDKMNPTEAALLRIAFQKDIHAGEFSKLTNLHRRGAIEEAQLRLNHRLSKFLPASLGYTFILEPPSDSRSIVEIGLKDSHGGFTSLGQRGSGIKKMISLLGRLALENVGTEPAILLLDEPEISLHADAQHALRYALEQLGKSPKLQVIYATHSSAMINPLRPQALRLLHRVRHKEQAWTKFNNRPVGDNYTTVRTSLGISPADSLIYSPVTVFVEGATEALCIPRLLLRLSESEEHNFSDAETLLSNTLFVSVHGDHFASQCTLAKAYGVTPIVYADGDRSKDLPRQLRKNHPEITVITPSNHTHEIEDIVPKEYYFKALGKFLKKEDETISVESFDLWCASANLPEKMLFSKRVGRWIEDTINPNFSGKPEIMLLACNDVPIDEIDTESLIRLMESIRIASTDPMETI